MQEITRDFPYTAQRKTYLIDMLGPGLMLLVEGVVFLLLIVFLVQPTLLKSLLLAIFVACYLCFAMIPLAPLWTKHQLTPTQLVLHYGRSLHVTIPRTAIRAAEPVHERLTMLQPMSARYVTASRRINAAFSDQGQVLLHLREPLPLKVGRATRPTESILMNVDARDEFLQAFAVSAVSAEKKISQLEKETPRQDEQASSHVVSFLSSKTPLKGEVAIRLEGLTRRFERFVAVDALDMALRPGEIYGFLGSNGAGKTTTIKMLVGLLQPSAGRAEIAGHDVWSDAVAAKALLGYVPDRSILYERLTGYEFLAFLAQMRGLSRTIARTRIARLLDLLELGEQADRLCGSYSFGMKRKLALAAALLHAPQVLVLDEPLNGLDPRSARRLKDLLLQLAAHGTTILFSTHDLATAESICHRIGILHRGRLLAEGSAAELRQLAVAPDLEAVFLSLTSKQPEEVGR